MSDETCQIAQIIQGIKDIILPIATTVVGAIISGFATYRVVKWQIKKKEISENIKSIQGPIIKLQKVTVSNFSIGNPSNIEKAITDVTVSYELCLYATQQISIFMPQDIRKAINKYLESTHHNIVVWVGKIRKDPVYKNDALSPYCDQALDKGKANKAFEELQDKLSKYARSI